MIIIDRILNEQAVCFINDKYVDIPLSEIKGNAYEGDVLIADKSGKYMIYSEETKNRRNLLTERFNKIKVNNKIK